MTACLETSYDDQSVALQINMRHCLLINTDPALHCIAPTLTTPTAAQSVPVTRDRAGSLSDFPSAPALGCLISHWWLPGAALLTFGVVREPGNINTATLHTFIVSEDIDVSDMSGWAADARAGQDNP